MKSKALFNKEIATFSMQVKYFSLSRIQPFFGILG